MSEIRIRKENTSVIDFEFRNTLICCDVSIFNWAQNCVEKSKYRVEKYQSYKLSNIGVDLL